MGRTTTRILIVALGAVCVLLSCSRDESAKDGRQETPEAAAGIWQDGEVAAVLERLDKLPRAEQDEPWALHMRGRALLASEGDDVREKVLELFSDALSGDPLDIQIRLDLARLLSRQGMRVKAIRILEEGRGFAPQESRLCFEIARTYLDAGETEGALKEVNRGLSFDPDAAEGHLIAGQILFDHTNRKEEGLDRMRRALGADRSVEGGRSILAKALVAWSINQESLGDHDAAFALIEEALQLEPHMPIALLERGRMLVQRGNLEQGIDCLRSYLEAHNDDDAVRSLLAGALKALGYQRLRNGKRPEALELFRETIALGAPDVDVAVIERIVEHDGNPAKRESLTESAKIDEARQLFERGSALLQERRAADALVVLEKSLELVPANPFARHQIGVAHAMEGRFERAVKDFETAIGEADAMELELPAAYVKLAEVVYRLGKPDESRRWLDKHDAAFPDRKDDPRVRSLRALLDD